MFVTIQIQFKFHQRDISFQRNKSCNSPQEVIIGGCWRRRAFHMPWVHMLGNHHQEWQQNMLVIFFHNCCNFVSAYIFHDALQPFKPWIELKNAHVVCSSSIKGHSKSHKDSNTLITSSTILLYKISNFVSNSPHTTEGLVTYEFNNLCAS